MEPDNSVSLRGTYCLSLREQSIWRMLEPILRMSPGLKAGEVKEGSDFNFRLGNDTATLSILLLTPSSIEASVAEETTFRLRQFSSLAGGVDKEAVVYLLSEAPFHSASGRYRLDGLVALQALMIESLPNVLPVIPIADADCFLASVQEYITNLEAIKIPRQQCSANTMGFARSRFFSATSFDEQGGQSFRGFAG
ncbi:hypothetical protein BO85DRAFT_275497 [Aspergillus piperis CBS 112811]|uniref:Uncharacterized protein n=1 Tax=Aspergillus piperis CBS 112811 TaxID=1448313 RepID=A0A8G1VQ74_9EURO|nr:hypothetical protein BO85DRAFT_275497 [Aspergillus piperis CBS 112811]RAH58463.1 hypothetical protein BO85DRAFT_275497 [Aspergillus piperis CBS 112811]